MLIMILRSICCGLLFIPTIAFSLECATSRCYSNAFESADASAVPALKRVVDIFENLGRTIGSSKALHSELMVIESDGYPWAVALSDNTIVITTGAIKTMYADGDFELGDARAAFILGHELSHLETDDLFHHRAFVSNNTGRTYGLEARPEEEIRADLRGYTYASIAGYATDRLLTEGDDFFNVWLTKLVKQSSPTHPDNKTRLKFLQAGFARILRDVPYYHHATALAHFGHYRDAQLLFEDFLNHVETKEAYVNLGYIHLQRARDEMPVNMAYKWWFPTLLEPASGLKIPRGRSLFDKELPQKALRHLKAAERYFKFALGMDDTIFTAHVNLAVVYLYMPDKVHRAYASIEDALNTDLGKLPAIQSQLESIYQIIRIQDDYDNTDRWPQARDRMEQLVQDNGVSENLLYNFARMLDDRGRDNTADGHWQTLYDNRHELPAAYRAQVCFRLTIDTCGGSDSGGSPWARLGLPVEKDIRFPEVQNVLKKKWNASAPPAKLLPDMKAEIYTNIHGDSLLALDNHIEMMILRNIPEQFRKLSDLQASFGNPLVALPLADGQLLSYDNSWAAVIKAGKVVEVWIAKLIGSTSNLTK